MTLLVKIYGVHLLARSETLKNVSNLLSNPQSMEEQSWERRRGVEDCFFSSLEWPRETLRWMGPYINF
jgi:hypothetical protein